ncbi:GNAT family N-acetyltransferase [Flavobacterium cerinum]|uniref:N-acetyltransferase n=1 Tax=Flavobacterium cerinum TaxID=2502784 RepID=A0A444HDY1_9FLAO|nr:GNAT family N-acetyltransferase [Flavobacterium cerinum]RWX02501.1 N-acetyltransferase [Flavobacterium cerinum]
MKLPPYSIFPNITGDKVFLRQIETNDISDIIEISFYDAIQATTEEEAIEMQDKINKDYTDGSSIHWGIADSTTNKIVGTCGYYRGLDNGAGELGFVLLPQHRGKGFMTAAVALAVDFGINTIGLKRIWAETTQDNESAIKVLERLHFCKTANLEDSGVEYDYICNKISG